MPWSKTLSSPSGEILWVDRQEAEIERDRLGPEVAALREQLATKQREVEGMRTVISQHVRRGQDQTRELKEAQEAIKNLKQQVADAEASASAAAFAQQEAEKALQSKGVELISESGRRQRAEERARMGDTAEREVALLKGRLSTLDASIADLRTTAAGLREALKVSEQMEAAAQAKAAQASAALNEQRVVAEGIHAEVLKELRLSGVELTDASAIEAARRVAVTLAVAKQQVSALTAELARTKAQPLTNEEAYKQRITDLERRLEEQGATAAAKMQELERAIRARPLPPIVFGGAGTPG